MVYVVTQTPHFGYYPENAQYINTPYAAHNTLTTPRATTNPQNSFRYPLSDAASTSSYDTWCTALAAAGTGMIRLIWGGRNSINSPEVYDLEPPPYGKYNIWHTNVLDDSNLTTFRSYQVSGSPGDGTFPIAYWNRSNIKQLMEACDTHGIEVIVELSHNSEWDNWWRYHPWNYENYYINGTRCEVADRGFLSDKTQIYTDPDALQAMKDRITFVIDLIGGYKCVCMWGLCSEGRWNFNPEFWGEDSFNSTMIDNIRNYIVPWYAAVATHIRDEDVYNRPIMSSVAKSRTDGTWPPSADAYANVMMEPLVVYPIDIVGTNCYQGDYEKMVLHLNAIRTEVHPKQILIHQYYPEPWKLRDLTLRVENSPYTDSKRVEWLGMALKWSTGPGRWMGLVEQSHNFWLKGGYADPGWYGIGAVTEAFRGVIDWKAWTAGAADWSAFTSSAGLSYSLTTGTANQFVGVLVWTSGGAKTLTITGVTDGAWTFTIFDWTDGSVAATVTPVAAGNSVAVAVTPSTYSQAFVYGTKD